jgi:hypothetical protein
MIELNSWDSSVLARIAQYQELPFETRWKMLQEVQTNGARRVGLALLKDQLTGQEQETHEFEKEWNEESAHISADVLETAQALRSWSEKTRYVTANFRSAAAKSAAIKD